MGEEAKKFLSDTKQYLLDLETSGYDKCHKVEGYNVDACHQDCQNAEKSDFAKNCEKEGGLYKCCIRLV